MRQPVVLLALGLASRGIEAFSQKRTDNEAWMPAKPTNVIDPMIQQALGLGTSPRPTQAPRNLRYMELQPRLDGYTLGPGTCGYVSSNENSFTCINTAATCGYDGDHLGCCVPNQGCTAIKTTCIDYSASKSGACNLPKDWHTLCCDTAALGACYTWLFSTATDESGELSTYSFLDCSARGGTGTLLDYDPGWSRTHSYPSTTSTVSSETATATDDGNSTGGNNNGDNGNKSSGKSKTNIGAIAGGAAGGVAVLASIFVAIFLILRRRSRQKDIASGSQSSPSAQMTNPSGPNSPPPMANTPSSHAGPHYSSGVSPVYQGYSPQGQQPNYDPHMSMYSQQGYPVQGSPPHGYQQPYQPGQPQMYPHQAVGGYQHPYAGSPPPRSPSPIGHAAAPAQELGTVNPVGMETNRAELPN